MKRTSSKLHWGIAGAGEWPHWSGFQTRNSEADVGVKDHGPGNSQGSIQNSTHTMKRRQRSLSPLRQRWNDFRVDLAQLTDQTRTIVGQDPKKIIQSATPLSRRASEEDVSTLRVRKSKVYKHLQFGTFSLKAAESVHSFGFPGQENVDGMPGMAIVTGPAMEAGHPVWTVESGQLTLGCSGAPVIDTISDLTVGMVVSVTETEEGGSAFGHRVLDSRLHHSVSLSVCDYKSTSSPGVVLRVRSK